MLKRNPTLQHEADLLRVLICRVFAALSQEGESLPLTEQVKLYTLILRAVSSLVSLQRGVAAEAAPQDMLSDLLETLHKELQE